MKLSELAYKCIKNSVFLDDNSFTYDYFMNVRNNIENSIDYSNASNNVLIPLNAAIARLSDLNRIPFRIDEFTLEDDGTIDLSKKSVKEVIGVAKGTPRQFVKLDFSSFGANRIVINGSASEYDPVSYFIPLDIPIGFRKGDKVMVEYKPDIPYFDNMRDSSVDLKEYGITDSMCSYIVEYTMGRLNEQLEPVLAQNHLTRAEQYFNGLKPYQSAFVQRKTYAKYTI